MLFENVDTIKTIFDHSRLFLALSLIIYTISLSLGIILVFFERRNPTVTIAWLMTLIFLPIVGFILFVFFGQNFSKNKRLRLKIEEDNFHKYIWRQETKLENNRMNYSNPEIIKYQDLIRLNLIGNESLYSEDNLVEVYVDGKQKFDALLESLVAAKKYIHMEYYIFRSDDIGRKILRILEQKASEGVEVKMLYDAIGGINLSSYFFNELKKHGGQVASFFPSFLYYFNLRINYRNHRKIAIIDGKQAFVGGFNVGDEYLGLSKKFGYWRDTHLKIKGSAVSDLQRQFLLDWKFASQKPMKYDEYKYFPKPKVKGNTGIQIVSSGPDSIWTSIKDGYFKMITSANKNIYIQTPYFVPDESILQALKVSALSGVDVRIIIPDKPDQPFVYWASYAYVGELLNSGVKCYTYNKGFIHSKTIVIDSLVSSVGTANIDVRSFNLNFEINAFMYDKSLAEKLEQHFIDDLTFCTEITLDLYNKRSTNIKIKESISRLLSALL